MSHPRSLGDLVDHQIRRYRVEEQARKSPARQPCIALSRLPGSGADDLGAELAQRLGYGFFGIEIVDHIARQRGVQRELVLGLDERVRGAIETLIDGLQGRVAPFGEADYARQLVRVIATLGERGGAVIVGRGSPQLLGPEHALRVLVVAPREARVERFAKRHDLSDAEARARLEREETARREFLWRTFRVDPDDASLYDLSVNTESLGIEGAATLIERALAQRFPGARGTVSSE
jgi:cytidylate kinase